MNKIVLVTGATSGFGKAIAGKFASHGYDIILTGRRKEKLAELQKELAEKQNIKCISLAFDVRDREHVFQSIQNLSDSWKKINVLVNNAGLALGRDLFDEADLDDWDTMMATNVNGLLYVSKAVLPLMIKNKNGHIINLGSVAGKEVYERGNIYCASKFSVDAISKAMRIDLLRHKIKVTSVDPGAADTEFSLVRFKGNKVKADKVYEGYKPLYADDVAEVVYYVTTLPEHVCINDLELTCMAQANSFYTYKE